MESRLIEWINWPVSIEGESFSDRSEAIHALNFLEIPSRVRTCLQELLEDRSPTLTVNTSGSTGAPKAIQFSIHQAIASAEATASALQLQPGMTALLALDPSPIAGRMMLVRALHLGMRLICCEPTSLPERPSEAEVADFTSLVPRQVEMLVEVAPKRLEQMGTILIGGGPIAPATEAILAERRMQAYHSFAMTETLSHFALRKLGCDIEYKALPGVQLSTDIQGRLRVKCPWATEPELQTNDIVAMTSTNRFRWLGRADFVINSGAVKVLPEQVEEFLSAWIDVPFAIVGLPDAEWGQRAVLVLERVFEVNLDQIEFPHPAWKPTRIRVVPHLPRTSNGKLARADLIGQLLSSDTGAIH